MTVHYPDKRVRKTKELFKETILALMEEKSFHEITITEIVKVADLNRGTFYAHYEKKEDLLDEMIGEMFEKMTEAYRKPYHEIPILDFTKLQPESIVFFNHFLENKRFYKIMFSKITNHNFSERLIKHLEPLFRQDFDYAATIDDNQLDIHLFGTYRIYGAIGLLLEWINNDFKQDPLYIADQLIRIYKSYTPKIYVKK
jgi:AcrR family transcriptional regulator